MSARLPIVLLFVITIITIFNFQLVRKNIFGGQTYVVVSGSMSPNIPVGSIIYTLQKDLYQKGDIITFMQNEEVISHRIDGMVRVGSELYYSTKGDANDVVDEELVGQGQVLGEVAQIVPHIGFLVLFYKNPVGLLVGILIPTCIVSLLHFRLQKTYSLI